MFCRPMITALFVAVSASFAAAPASQPATAASGPIQFEAIERANPPLKLFVARVDLTDPRVRIGASPGGPDPDGGGPWETILSPASAQAKAHDFDLAVNATFFNHTEKAAVQVYAAGSPASSAQPVMIDGRFVTQIRRGPVMLFRKDNAAEMLNLPARVPADARTIVGGSEQIVTFGRVTAKDDPPAPRTAIGLADGGKTLVLLVVDGRREKYSVGLSLKGLAAEMIAFGCQSALNLDGGGSSTMVRKLPSGEFKVANRPSDGSQLIETISLERPVAYVLGVRVEGAK